MKILDAFNSLKAAVAQAEQHMPVLADIEAQKVSADAELKATFERLEAIKVELRSTHAALDRARQEHDEALKALRIQHGQTLAEFQQKIEDARIMLAQLNSEVRQKQDLHKQIEDSIASMRKKFA